MDLFKTISWEMGLSVERSRAALYRQIKSEVSRLCADARTRPILVVDEAHQTDQSENHASAPVDGA